MTKQNHTRQGQTKHVKERENCLETTFPTKSVETGVIQNSTKNRGLKVSSCSDCDKTALPTSKQKQDEKTRACFCNGDSIWKPLCYECSGKGIVRRKSGKIIVEDGCKICRGTGKKIISKDFKEGIKLGKAQQIKLDFSLFEEEIKQAEQDRILKIIEEILQEKNKYPVEWGDCYCLDLSKELISKIRQESK